MRWILNVEAPSIESGFPNLASLVVVWNPFQSSQVTKNNQRKFSTVSDYPKIMVICIPASLLRGFEEALLAAVPEPSYLLMPTIATRCWQHVEDLSNRRYYQNQCWCKWWSFHCLNPQFPQKAANGPHGGSAATMGPGDHWEQVFFQLGWFGWLFLVMRIKHLLMTSTIIWEAFVGGFQ